MCIPDYTNKSSSKLRVILTCKIVEIYTILSDIIFCVYFCAFIFSYNRMKRIKEYRWDIGSVLPQDVRLNLAEQEVTSS